MFNNNALDFTLIGDSLIRPNTLAKFARLHYKFLSIEEFSNLANLFISFGIDYSIRGDVLFILMLYINEGKTSLINNDYLNLGEFDTPEESIINIYNIIQKMLKGGILYTSYSKNEEGVTINDLICYINKPGYDTRFYSSYKEAELYGNTYLFQFNRIYMVVFNLEYKLYQDKGLPIKPVTKSDLINIDKIRRKNIDRAIKDTCNRNLVIYNDDSNLSVAILLAQKYECPFIKSDDITRFEDFNVIDADNLND